MLHCIPGLHPLDAVACPRMSPGGAIIQPRPSALGGLGASVPLSSIPSPSPPASLNVSALNFLSHSLTPSRWMIQPLQSLTLSPPEPATPWAFPVNFQPQPDHQPSACHHLSLAHFLCLRWGLFSPSAHPPSGETLWLRSAFPTSSTLWSLLLCCTHWVKTQVKPSGPPSAAQSGVGKQTGVLPLRLETPG